MSVFISLIISISFLILDQVTKHWAATELLVNGPVELWPGVFHFHYTENRGVAFSLLQDQRWVFIPISLLMTALIIVMLLRSPMRKSKLFCFASALVISGAIGNLIDRIHLGYVIDFLYFRLIDFPIFNIADCCVVIGAILLFTYVLFGMKNMEDMPLKTLFFGITGK